MCLRRTIALRPLPTLRRMLVSMVPLPRAHNLRLDLDILAAAITRVGRAAAGAGVMHAHGRHGLAVSQRHELRVPGGGGALLVAARVVALGFLAGPAERVDVALERVRLDGGFVPAREQRPQGGDARGRDTDACFGGGPDGDVGDGVEKVAGVLHALHV